MDNVYIFVTPTHQKIVTEVGRDMPDYTQYQDKYQNYKL